MANRLYGWQSGDQNYAKHSLSVTPFAGSYGFRLDAYQEVGGWSIEKDSGEDADMMPRLARSVGDLQQLDSMVEISGRVRGESFLGNEASIVSIAGSRLSIEARVASALTAQPYEQVILDHFTDHIRQHLILACQEITRRLDIKPGPLSFFLNYKMS